MDQKRLNPTAAPATAEIAELEGDAAMAPSVAATIAPRGKVRIASAKGNREREEVYRFRYQVYVEEMGRMQKHADHLCKRIAEPLDTTGHLLVARDDSGIVGTARFNVGVDQHFGLYEEMYGLRAFGPFYPSGLSITTKLMVAPAYRRSTLPLQLAIQCFKRGIVLGTSCFDCIDCNPPLVGFFTRLGYRQVFPSVSHPEYGEVAPMILALYDVDHMRACGSPFAKIAPAHDERGSVAFFYGNILNSGRSQGIS